MSRVSCFEENWMVFKSPREKYMLNKLLENLESYHFQMIEGNKEVEVQMGKNYGLSFYTKDSNGTDKETCSVKFKNQAEFEEFCESYERVTSAYDDTKFPRMISEDLPAPYSLCRYTLEENGKLNFLMREDFIKKFEDYQLGNVQVKSVMKCVYENNNKEEVKYYEYRDKLKIEPGSSYIETGFLITISGNEVFLYDDEEVEELLNDLCLGEEDLCEEEELVKKLDYPKYDYYED